MLLVKNCRLIAELTEGYDKEYADILVNDENKIERIMEPGALSGFAGETIDAENQTVLPGFFDLHAHLYLTSLDFLALDNRNEIDSCFDMYRYARNYLKQGYTTIRDAGCPFNITAGMARAAKKGIVNIPMLISSGKIMTPTETGNGTFKVLYQVADSPYEVRRGCREQFELGNDVIKYMVTGAYLNESGDPGITIATEDELLEAVRIAKMKGSYVMGHAHGAEGIKLGIRAGLRTIEHGSFIDDEAIEMLKNSETTFLVPTAGIGLISLIDSGGMLSADAMDKATRFELAEKNCINKAYRAGLKLGFGSDIDEEHLIKCPGLEFYARTDWYDFKYMDILLQATKYSAEIAGLDGQKGTIKAGKNAELVVIEGRPEEDIYVMKKLPKYVLFNGEIIKN